MEWAAITYPGTRPVNEDCTGVADGQQVQCFIVADGLGGHGKGEIASRLAVEAFQKVFQQQEEAFLNQELPMEDCMRAAFTQAQEDILAEQLRTHSAMQMKTTVVALAVGEKNVLWGHIGDTRLYGFRFHRVKTVTRDHSIPQMLVDIKEIKRNEIRNHPDRNKLLRVLGVSGDNPRYELSNLKKRRSFQAFLLCTDGFWELILEKEMQQCLKKANSAQQWLELMAEIVRCRGEGREMDNFSAIGVLL